MWRTWQKQGSWCRQVECRFVSLLDVPEMKSNLMRKGEMREMAQVNAFYSLNEIKKPVTERVYHNNGACPPGRDIPLWERKQGTGNYRLCDDCDDLNKKGR